jgi:hypothetical protein
MKFDDAFINKSDATKRAGRIKREKGLNARVVKNMSGKPYIWCVYTSKKK